MAEAEAPIRLDALDGWPAPEAEGGWLGSPGAEASLRDAYTSGRVHHGWLLGGPRGIGKATLAYRFARFVLAHPDPRSVKPGVGLAIPEDSSVFRRVAARAHPDLITLERPFDEKNKRFKTELTVDEIRRTVPFFGSTAGEGGWRIAVVDAADDMNPSAANALLKVLEEPPPRSLFLIVAHAPGRLLPTIRSRCRNLTLSPLPAETIASALRGSEGSAAESQADLILAARLSGGSLRRAVQLLEAGGLDLYRGFLGLTASLPDIDYRAMHAFADRVAARGADEEYDAFLDILRDWLDRRVLRAEEPEETAKPSPAVAGAPLARWAEVWEKITETAGLADELNLDRKQVVLTTFMTLARATRM